MWLLLSERRDLLRKEPLSILQRKEVPHLRYTCKFLCMRKKKEKNSSSSSSRGYICRPSFDLMEIATDR